MIFVFGYLTDLCMACRFIDEGRHLGPNVKSGFFPDLSVVTIAGAGHWVHVTNPTELHTTVASLLRRNARMLLN